jgi:hypothetical protein
MFSGMHPIPAGSAPCRHLRSAPEPDIPSVAKSAKSPTRIESFQRLAAEGWFQPLSTSIRCSVEGRPPKRRGTRRAPPLSFYLACDGSGVVLARTGRTGYSTFGSCPVNVPNHLSAHDRVYDGSSFQGEGPEGLNRSHQELHCFSWSVSRQRDQLGSSPFSIAYDEEPCRSAEHQLHHRRAPIILQGAARAGQLGPTVTPSNDGPGG